MKIQCGASAGSGYSSGKKNSEISSVGKKSAEIPAWAKVLWIERAELNYFVNTKREEAGSGQMVNWCCAKGSGRSCNLREKRHFISPPYEDE